MLRCGIILLFLSAFLATPALVLAQPAAPDTQAQIAALQQAGIVVAQSPADMGAAMQRALKK